MRAIRNKPLLAAAFAAAAVMIIGSVLPVWVVWRVFPEMWEAVGEYGTLWRTSIWLPQNILGLPVADLWKLHLWNVVGLAILSSVSTAVGTRVYLSRRRRVTERGD